MNRGPWDTRILLMGLSYLCLGGAFATLANHLQPTSDYGTQTQHNIGYPAIQGELNTFDSRLPFLQKRQHGILEPTPALDAMDTTSTVILPKKEPNATRRIFPYTPPTGANNSLYLTPNVASRDGLVEIKIGVLLPYSLPNNLTQQLTFSGTSAIRMAASEINEKRLIPGAYITLVLKDSFNGADPENSGAAQAIFSTVDLLEAEGGISGVIGDVSSSLTIQSALLTSRLSIPQCSFSAGSTQLSSKDDYGHFFRTIPTELMFGRVMVDFVVSRGWKTVAIFYTGDSLGSEMLDYVTERAKKKNLNIGFRHSFWEMGSSSDVGPALDALQDSGQRIIIVAAVGIPQVKLMIEAVRRGMVSKDYVWLNINQVTEPLLEMQGSTIKPSDLNGLFMFDNMLKLHGYPPYEQFLDKWAALSPAEYPFAGQRDISSNEAQAYSCAMVMATGFANAVKGNWTALHLLASGRLGSKLRPTSLNTNYTGPAGPMLLDEYGDVVYGNFIIYNFQDGRMVSIGTSYSGVLTLSSPPMYFDGTYVTPPDSAPLHVLNPKIGSSIGVVVATIAGLGVIFCLVTMGLVIYFKNSQVIKASSPLFCCLELCGFILLYAATIMGLDIPSNNACMIQPVTLNIGFILVVGNIVAKNFRVYRIFHNIYVTKRVIRDSHLLKIVGSILTGNLIIIVIWFVKAKPTRQQIIMQDLTTYYSCNSQSGPSTPYFATLFAYNVGLLLVATYLAYMNRNVAANYNECRQIAFVVYNILLSGCIAMPTIFLPQDQFFTKFFLSNVVILFGTTVALMFMFLPKLWKLFSQLERQTQQGRVGGADENSFDSFFNAGGGWLGRSGQGGSTVGGGGQYVPGGRKGSVGTLDDSKGETLKESHMGYMGVKFQNRYLPFLSSWTMRRVILYPADRYFTCFEPGKCEAARTYSYHAAFVFSQEPGAYILRVVGRGRYNFLLQVKDEDRLMHWCGLFENKQGGAYPAGSGQGTVMPLSQLPMGYTQTRSESDNTLQATYPHSSGKGRQHTIESATSPKGLQTPRLQHRYTMSTYTNATLTCSPRASIEGSPRTVAPDQRSWTDPQDSSRTVVAVQSPGHGAEGAGPRSMTDLSTVAARVNQSAEEEHDFDRGDHGRE